MITAISSDYDVDFKFKYLIPGLLIFIFVLFRGIGISYMSADFENGAAKAKLLQVKELRVDSKLLNLADPEHVCLVSEEVAKSKAENALGQFKLEDGANAGSRFKMEAGTKQYVDGQLWWIFPLDFVSYFQWKKYPVSPGYVRVSAEDPKAEAQAVQHAKDGSKIEQRYLNSSSFDFLAERYLRKNGYLNTNINDFTYEVDDNWKPFYTVSVRQWTIGYEGDVVTDLLLLDVQTGKITVTPIKDVTKKYPWIDRANDIDVINYQSKKWGEFSKVGWTFTSVNDGKRKKPTDGWYMVYDEGTCYWFTGWTSYSESSDLIGVSLSNANTGETSYYPTSGCTEVDAQTVAQSHWSNFPTYSTTEMSVYNFYGMLTYVIPIVSNRTEYVGVSLVSVKNKAINSKGSTLEEALSSYRNSMSSANMSRGVAYEGQAKTLTLNGTISQVGKPFFQGQNQVYPFMLQGVSKIFQVVYSPQLAKISFIKEGDQVSLSYMDTKEQVITCSKFDIPKIQLTDENPSQARWEENSKVVKKEEQRIDKQQTKNSNN